MKENQLPEELTTTLQVLEGLMPEYHGRTLDNIIQNLRARLEYYQNP